MIESETTPDTNSAEANQTAPDAGAAEQATSQQTEQSGEATATQAPAENSGTQQGTTDPHGSSATPDATTQIPNQAKAPQGPVDWQKRYKDVQSYANKQKLTADRLQQEQAQLRQQYAGLDANAIRQWQQASAEAARRNLKRWDSRHPEHGNFRSLLDRARAIDSQLQALDPNLPPEARDAATKAIRSALSPDEVGELNGYRQEAQRFHADLISNPRGALAPIIQEEIRAALGQERSRMQADQAVQRDLAHPVLAELAKDPESNQRMSHIMSGLQRGEINPWQVAKHIALLEKTVEDLQSRAGEADSAKAHAGEQKRLLEQGASHTRDPNAQPIRNLYREATEIAKQRGIKPGDPRFMVIVRELEKTL